jgi:hypothetical protein
MKYKKCKIRMRILRRWQCYRIWRDQPESRQFRPEGLGEAEKGTNNADASNESYNIE